MLGLLVRQSSVNNDNRVFYEKMKRAPLETRCFFLVENVRGRDRNRKLICACPYRDQQAEANAIFMLRFRQSDCNMFRVQFVGSYQEAELCNDKRCPLVQFSDKTVRTKWCVVRKSCNITWNFPRIRLAVFDRGCF